MNISQLISVGGYLNEFVSSVSSHSPQDLVHFLADYILVIHLARFQLLQVGEHGVVCVECGWVCYEWRRSEKGLKRK